MPLRTLLLLPMALRLIAAPAVLEIRPAPSNEFVLEVAKTGLYNGKFHRFVFNRYRGRLQLQPDVPEKTQVEFVIESASAVCTDTWVDAKDLKKIESYALNKM